METDTLRLFVLAADKLNISAAGRELGLAPSVASSWMSKLEKSVGADLLHRSTRKVALSTEGLEFLPYARDIVAREDAARAALGQGEARINPEDEWIIHQVPELRIVYDDLWASVKERQSQLKHKRGGELTSENHFRDRRRPKYLFSGLTKCACCGGGYTMISADLVGCATARNKGTCDNRKNIRRDHLEDRVLGALRHHLMEPALFKEFCDEFTGEMNRLRIEERSTIKAGRTELAKIDRDLDKILQLFLNDALPVEMVKEKSKLLESRKLELENFLANADEPPPLLHPEMAGFYRLQVEKLHSSLQDEIEAKRLEATEILRSLVDEIILTPTDDEMLIDVRGDLAGILGISLKRKKPTTRAGQSQFELVAGVGFEPTTFRL
ncbi:LysR family transcriptional regulator [Pseudooctadecabacter sp.]|uniref:LysR family transcriptional regulator n=1 Tax=Pseudooctadecabacter sp. TaxID=1966338 RepID=UPI003F6BAC3C